MIFFASIFQLIVYVGLKSLDPFFASLRFFVLFRCVLGKKPKKNVINKKARVVCMAVTIVWLGPLLSLILLILIVFLVFWLGKNLVWLIVNSIVGIAILYLINFLPGINIPINIWSVLITVFGGVPGIILLVLLSWMGVVI